MLNQPVFVLCFQFHAEIMTVFVVNVFVYICSVHAVEAGHCATVSWQMRLCVVSVMCVCVCVCVPLFLNTSRVPPLSRMGQQVSRSLARTLPVLFWTSWLPRRGCQSSQPFPSHPTALQPLWPQLHSFYSNDMNKYSLWFLYYTLAVFFIIILYNFTWISCVLFSFWLMSGTYQLM